LDSEHTIGLLMICLRHSFSINVSSEGNFAKKKLAQTKNRQLSKSQLSNDLELGRKNLVRYTRIDNSNK